jgi:hypothetical protein
MSTQHTPGPWYVEIDHATGIPDFIRAHMDGEMFDVARIDCSETGNAKADARLIAASPALLDLCRRALRALDEDSYPQLRDDLREAIDKAEAE